MPQTAPKPADASISPASLIGRDEMNFAEFPIALADRAKTDQKTLYFDDEHGRLTVTGSDAYGLPTSRDTDVIVALIYLTKKRNDFEDRKVNFSRYEIIKLLNWGDEGDNYKRLDESFNRWMGVMLVFDKCWWDNKKKKYVNAKMHILESVFIADVEERKRDRQTDLPLSTFSWNQTFIESCQADNLRQLNLDIYFSLKSAVAKRLYRFLGKRFYRQGDWTFDLNEIAFDRVGLSRSYEGNAGKIKAKLAKAIEELESRGFLRPLSREKRYKRIDRGKWTIRFIQQAPAPDSPPPTPALLAPPQADPAASSPLVAELTSRGVTRKTAVDLVKRHQAEAIVAKIDVFDWLAGRNDKRVTKSPAGYLVKSINDDYATPEGYITKAERERQAEAEQAASAEARRTRAEAAKADRIIDQAKAYLQSRTPDQLALLEADAIAQASEETRQGLDKLHMKPFRKTQLFILVREHIAHLIESGQLVAESA